MGATLKCVAIIMCRGDIFLKLLKRDLQVAKKIQPDTPVPMGVLSPAHINAGS